MSSNKLNLAVLSILATIAVFSYKHGIVARHVIGHGIADEIEHENFDSYFINHISIDKYSDQGVLYSISAEKITHRNRRFMNLATYQNLKEVYITDLRLDAYANDDTILLEDLTTTVQSLESRPYANEKPRLTMIDDQIISNSDNDDLDLLTQVLFEKITINLHHPSNKITSITARTGRINLGNENLVLEEGVKLITADNSEILASQAVWSNKYNGIYFPAGCFFEKQRMEKAFFRFNKEGNLSRSSMIPVIAYTDRIAEREQALYEQSVKDMSPYMKAMLGIPIRE